MFRGTTARAVVSLLATVLLTLSFFAPTASFASAHTARHAEAKAQPGFKPTGKALRDELVTFRDCTQPGGPANPFRTRDRHHVTTSADSAPQEPERPLLVRDPAAAHRPPEPGIAYHRSSRSSTAHSPAALQVFRC
ncbi:hypothetical protein ABZY09_24385 [Streptomyces sp. NPDC002928]|uniref:hypothetical protein n=1 Tax=Streptomyces sp. NPDC002928 TaxID=3154440 RepID=UPI0033AAAFA4